MAYLLTTFLTFSIYFRHCCCFEDTTNRLRQLCFARDMDVFKKMLSRNALIKKLPMKIKIRRD